MTDTPAALDQRFHAMLLAKSGAERILMASGMFESARQLMLASLPPGLSPAEIRTQLLTRTYPELATGPVASGGNIEHRTSNIEH